MNILDTFPIVTYAFSIPFLVCTLSINTIYTGLMTGGWGIDVTISRFTNARLANTNGPVVDDQANASLVNLVACLYME